MKLIKWTSIILVLAVGAIYGFNYLTVIQPTQTKIQEDERNEGISVDVHYKFYVIPTTLVYDLKTVPTDKAAADVFRVFLQTSSALKDKTFEIIELSYKGQTKFFIKGDYFSELGNEFGTQNPMYTIRTFPENVFKANGEAAYLQWTGGALGVLGKQMEDFNDFNKNWYLDDLVEENRK
jgi:hypothetical protein